jgi:RNA-directed DNA polymerase
MSNTEVTSPTFDISIASIVERENMQRAFAAVKSNKGSAGVDGRSIEVTASHLVKHWDKIRQRLLTGQYQPTAVRAVTIPKANGGTRQLGIPSVQDRLIQQAMQQILTPTFDSLMSPHSYGFRPNRSAHDAVEAARGHVKAGKKWVIDIDLKHYFDQVNHDRLMHMLKAQISDKQVLSLIGRYLRAPLRHADGRQQQRTRGTPQGGPLSPLLANIYLDPLDKELERRGIAFVRYADDIAIFTGSERAAKRILDSVKDWLIKQLDLDINADKSGTSVCSESQLLGFRIHEKGDVSIADSALVKLKARVRAMWDGRQSLTTDELRKQWQEYITGWWNYFKYANWRYSVQALSGWIRRHMRKCFWLRWHNRAGRRNALVRLGVRGRGLQVAGCRRGAWAMSVHVVVNQALKTATLTQFGFVLPWTLASKT